MAVIADTRPIDQVSDVEIVMELFRAARNQQMTKGKQLVAECKRMFPDLSEERRQACFSKLAAMLEKSQ